MTIIVLQLTRLIPDSKGTKCNVELEPVENTKYSHILRVPFKTEDGKDLHQWVSRFDIYPYLERYAQVCQLQFINRQHPCVSNLE
jgi:sucrose synthase